MELPGGLVLRALGWIKDRILLLLYRRTYRRSHLIWLEHHRLGSFWKRCGQHFEYSLHLATITDSEPRQSKIAIRAEKDLDELTLVFEARSGGARFQERIELLNVNQKPIVWTMAQIPVQDVPMINEDAGIRFTWSEYDISVTKLRLRDGHEVAPFKTRQSHLTHTWFLNSEWTNRWGLYWNLDAIKEAKVHLLHYWISELKYLHFGREISLMQRLRRKLLSPVGRVMASDWALSSQFWVAIWSGLFVLNNESRLQWRWEKSPSPDAE